MNKLKTIKIVLSGVTIAGAIICGGLLYILAQPGLKRDRFLIPEGYSGPLAVSFSVSGAPPLPMEDGFRLIKFNKDGVVKTSSEGIPGKLRDEYYFYSGNFRRPLDPNKMGGGFTEAPSDQSDKYTLKFSVTSAKRMTPANK